ncbi:MAG: M3 family metallopeptidase [Prevotellaceae bacterium]|nr:M3 family metallopeptidase [Prevotellaceae bacterium]
MTAQEKKNPFLSEYNTPFGTIPFNQIKTDDYLPAMREGMRLHAAEIETITNNPEAPTFENTIVALERSGKVLSRVQYCFYNLHSAETSDEMDKIAETIAPEETAHSNSITQNEKLFEKVKLIYNTQHKSLPVEKFMLLDKTYQSFLRSGATLLAADKEKYRKYTEELSLLQLQFSQNALKATNAYQLNITDKSQLAGIPEDILTAAQEKAKAKGKEGWIFDLTAPSYVPFMKYADNRMLREQLYMAYNTKALGGEFDNRETIIKIVNLRLQIAQLLGFKDYAAYALDRRMAKNETNVYKLLDELLAAYSPKAKEEVASVQTFAQTTGFTETIMPWDWSYYSEKLKEEKYSVNDELLKPYFELENVKKGVFGLATRLYGLQFKKNTNIQVYHPDVETFEVYDATGKFMAILYTDFFPREGKRSGAWMTEFKPQWRENGTDERPQISLVMNFSRPTATTPALLTFDEFTTFLHEFGHALHGMLADSEYESISGTNVYRDFVELPSQILENWATEKEYLDGFAVHYQTGEKIPAELIEKIKASENFNVAYACLRQLSFGYLDMAWHTQIHPFSGDVQAFEKQAWSKAIVLPQVAETCMSVQFSHVFAGGYAAGYYSYKWAEVLDADAFSVFKKNGIFDAKTAASFRENILSKGGSEDPAVLYRRFRGQDPTIDALLIRNGVK